jgi:hypothetical protein
MIIANYCTSSLESARSGAMGHAMLRRTADGSKIEYYRLAGLAGGYNMRNVDDTLVTHSGEPPAPQVPSVGKMPDWVAAAPSQPSLSQEVSAAALHGAASNNRTSGAAVQIKASFQPKLVSLETARAFAAQAAAAKADTQPGLP